MKDSLSCCAQGLTVRVEAGLPSGATPGRRAVEVAAHEDAEASTGAAGVAGGALCGDDIVAVNQAIGIDSKDLLEMEGQRETKVGRSVGTRGNSPLKVEALAR